MSKMRIIPHEVAVRAHLMHLSYVLPELCIERDWHQMEGRHSEGQRLQGLINALIVERDSLILLL